MSRNNSTNLRDLADLARNHIQQAYETFQNSTSGSSSRQRRSGGGPCNPSSASYLHEEEFQNNNPTQAAAHKVTHVVEQVFQTLFAPCVNLNVGNHHHPTYDDGGARYPPHSSKSASSHHHHQRRDPYLYKEDEFYDTTTDPYYAPFFHTNTEGVGRTGTSSDHGRTARAILLARQQEELDRQLQRFEDEPMIQQQTPSGMNRFIHRAGADGAGGGLLAKNIHIPITATTTAHPSITHDDGFDDGVSALSAHTLEDMARLHMRLEEAVLRKKGGHGIHVKATMMRPMDTFFPEQGEPVEVDPPSPASTENSEESQKHVAPVSVSSKQGRNTTTTTNMLQADVDDWLDMGPSQPVLSYPIQQQTHLEREKVSSRGASQVKTTQGHGMQPYIHPHDTLMSISAQDVVPKRSKKNKSSHNSMLNRKLNYDSKYQTAEI